MASDTFARWLKRQLRPSWVAETELRLRFMHRDQWIRRYGKAMRKDEYFAEPHFLRPVEFM